MTEDGKLDGGSKYLPTAATTEKKKLRTCDPRAGKFPNRKSEDIDIGSQNPCVATTAEEKRLKTRKMWAGKA